jgi:uncharacterized NAD(P)/FAD-binding protein YdhS
VGTAVRDLLFGAIEEKSRFLRHTPPFGMTVRRLSSAVQA